MKKSDTLVLGVIYPGVEHYLNENLHSLTIQTDKNFNLLLLNDRFNAYSINTPFLNTIIHNVNKKSNPAKIRQTGIQFAIDEGYKYLIFMDTDDYFDKFRVEYSKHYLKKYAFVYNELTIIDDECNILSKNILSQLNYEDSVKDYSFISDKNVMGLTNTAVNVSALKSLRIPDNTIAVDWWIFSILLINKKECKFISDTVTYYRQNKENLVGFLNKLTKERLFKGIEVKEIHYCNLSKYCEEHNYYDLLNLYSQKYKDIIELKNKINDINFLKMYIQVINKNFDNIYSGWWSEIIPFFEWRKYEN